VKLKDREYIFKLGRDIHPSFGSIGQNDYDLTQEDMDRELKVIDQFILRARSYRTVLLNNLLQGTPDV